MPEKGKAHPGVLGALRKEGKDYILPSSAWYITPEQASSYLRLANSKGYAKEVHEPEWELLEGFLKEDLPWTEKVNHVIDLGSGDGKKGVLFARTARDLGAKDVAYYPLDTSGHMLEAAAKEARRIGIPASPIQADLHSLQEAKSKLSKLEGKKAFLLLGNTLGNFSPDELLKNVSSLMNEGDLLFIGTGLFTGSPSEIESAYSDERILDMMHASAKALGLSKEDYAISTKFNRKKSAVEIFLEMKRAKRVSSGEREQEFKRGDRIRTAISYKYKEDGIVPLIKKHLRLFTAYFHDKKPYILAVAKKRAGGRFGTAMMGFDGEGNLVVLKGGEELFRPSVSGTRKRGASVRDGYSKRRKK